MNPVMNEIVSIYWDGPYESNFFLDGCTNFRIIKNVFWTTNEQISGFDTSDEVVQNPNKIVSSSLGIWSIADIKKQIKKTRKKTQNILFGMKKKDKEKAYGHYFMYKVWRDSLFVNQYASVISVITLSIVMQIYAFKALNGAISTNSALAEWSTAWNTTYDANN